jgi:hypothetical protein
MSNAVRFNKQVRAGLLKLVVDNESSTQGETDVQAALKWIQFKLDRAKEAKSGDAVVSSEAEVSVE